MFKDPKLPKKRPEVRRAKGWEEGCTQGLDNEAPRARHSSPWALGPCHQSWSNLQPRVCRAPGWSALLGHQPFQAPRGCQISQALGAEAERAGAFTHRKESRGAGVWAEKVAEAGGSAHQTGWGNGGDGKEEGGSKRDI